MTRTQEPTMRIGGTALLRNPQLEPLELAQLKRFSPAIFAKRPIEGVSDSYGFVNTADIIKAMADNNYACVEVRQSQRRGDDAEMKMGFTKHMLKFRKNGTLKSLMKLGDVVPQIVMLNSHDRSSGFHLYAGMFRLICLNGLIVSDSDLVEPLKIRHSASMVRDVVEKSNILTKGADGVYALRESMLSVKLDDKSAKRFALAALEFRPPRRAGLMTPDMLLGARREEDKPNDLWHVFNRVQENMMRGGLETVSTASGQERGAKTKGIGRIERDVEVNSKLWGLAVETVVKAGKMPKTRARKALSAAEMLA